MTPADLFFVVIIAALAFVGIIVAINP